MEEGPRKVAQALPVPSFPGGLPQPQGYPTSGRKTYKINSSIKQRPLVVASWSVLTLQDTGLGARRRTALIACELARYNIDIAALGETTLPDKGCIIEMGTGYISLLSGLPTVARRIHGVGFTVRTALLQSAKESLSEIIIIIMVILKCYFSGELIALSYKKKTKEKKTNNNNSGVNIELEKTNRLKALCMMVKK